jgi:glycosyltransferase involved in cell wall biosynthesis
VHRDEELCQRVPLSLSCVSCHCDRRSYAQKLWRVTRTAIQNRVLRMPEGVAHFVGVSKLSLDVMRSYLPEKASVTILRNPVDCTDYGPAPVEENAPFVFIGRFSKEKGVLLFAEAAARLGIPAVFIGDGEVRAEAGEICPQGTFTGWLSTPEIANWLRRARALVFPPLWYETLGLVVVEAASHGVPAIIADRCAATDFVEDGKSGLWFEHGSVDSLCEKLSAMQKKGRARALGQRAYEWYWADPWSTERHVHELIELYRGVLDAPVPAAVGRLAQSPPFTGASQQRSA